jgi:hypothetical protein
MNLKKSFQEETLPKPFRHGQGNRASKVEDAFLNYYFESEQHMGGFHNPCKKTSHGDCRV